MDGVRVAVWVVTEYFGIRYIWSYVITYRNCREICEILTEMKKNGISKATPNKQIPYLI